MMRSTLSLAMTVLTTSCVVAAAPPTTAPAHLPGELPASAVLDGEYPYPPSPPIEIRHDDRGLARQRLGRTPPPGVHPRVLISPDELPDLRRRLAETTSGKAMMQTLRRRTGGTILKAGTWENTLYQQLSAGDVAAAVALLNGKPKPTEPPGHYQPHVLYALTMESFDALVSDDAERGRTVASAVAGWAALVEPIVDATLAAPLHDDVWRVTVQVPPEHAWAEGTGFRDLFGGHLLGYAYDFSHPFMTDAQRQQVRRVIAKGTAGRVWLGARLPHHFRNWNWVVVALQTPLLALAIEGEEGYDPRVYRLAVQIANDYFTYGFSPMGSSTEAVGYTQFGLVWGNPFFVAAARRGDNLLTHPHHRASIDWYVHSMEPYGGRWQSHGDGGDAGPAIWTLSMWRYFFPDDPKVQLLWQQLQRSAGDRFYTDRFHLIEPLLWCEPDPANDHGVGEKLDLPLAFFDPQRGSLNVRSGWSADAAAVQFECRIDSHGPSHEHADRGHFTFSALGRAWSRESFRSIETRHHSNVLIDGQGQGFWPGPGVWIGHRDGDWAVMAACDARDAYAWWWPKSIVGDPPDAPRFQFPRWVTYRDEAERFRRDFAAVPVERDDRPAVVAFWRGFDTIAGGPRLWDEDGWPIRLPHNPVQRAFRTIAFVRGPTPYLIVADDIQKDEQVRLYEWLMQTGPDTELLSLKEHEAVLCDASVPRDANGLPRPAKGQRQLLVRVLERGLATEPLGYAATPSIRLESFEKRDTTSPAGRSFGLDKRLVIPSRSVSPGFKVLMIPFQAGTTPPQVEWDDAAGVLRVVAGETQDEWTFVKHADGRTRLSGRRGTSTLGPIEPQP
jgi:hypothetical protein